jgi:hypothetical protein
MANSIFSGRAHPEGQGNHNRPRTDSEQIKREQDCEDRIRNDHNEVLRNMQDHQDRLRGQK